MEPTSKKQKRSHHRLCDELGCQVTATYGHQGKACHCAKHRTSDDFPVRSKADKCCVAGCVTRASFVAPGTTRPTHCAKHKSGAMAPEARGHSTCVDCHKRACFGWSGPSAKPTHCAVHRAAAMIDVVRQDRCNFRGCNTRARYGPANVLAPTRCAAHAKADHVRLHAKKCAEPGCGIRPVFGIDSAPTHCHKHRLPRMVNVEDPTCGQCEQETRITTRATYGPPGGLMTACARHRLPAMIVLPRKRCFEASCSALGTYQFAGKRWCQVHAPDGAWSLNFETCPGCLEPAYLVSAGTHRLCDACAPQSRRLHKKEELVAHVLKTAGYTCIRDRMLEDASCGRERPDFQIDCGSFFVYVECDEDAHRSIPRECELVRMKNLTEVRAMPVVFVRFNPDHYVAGAGAHYLPPGPQRCAHLAEVMAQVVAAPPSGFLTVLWVCYDGYTGVPTPTLIL
jgi:hypothetical protein